MIQFFASLIQILTVIRSFLSSVQVPLRLGSGEREPGKKYFESGWTTSGLLLCILSASLEQLVGIARKALRILLSVRIQLVLTLLYSCLFAPILVGFEVPF